MSAVYCVLKIFFHFGKIFSSEPLYSVAPPCACVRIFARARARSIAAFSCNISVIESAVFRYRSPRHWCLLKRAFVIVRNLIRRFANYQILCSWRIYLIRLRNKIYMFTASIVTFVALRSGKGAWGKYFSPYPSC